MRINDKTRAFLGFSRDLLRYKKGLTLANIGCNVLIFSHYAATTFLVRQVLNGLEGAQGLALRAAWPYLVGILAAALVRVAAIMGCSALDALRSYYYQNRTRMNAMKRLLRSGDITRVSGRAGPLFEVLDDDVPACTFPAELLTEVGGNAIHMLISLTMLLLIDWRLTLFLFLPLSAAIYGVQRLSERMKERRRISREAHDAASAFIGDVADAALAIKTAGAQAAVLDRYDAVNARRRAAVMRDTVFGERVSVLLQGAVCVGSAVVMFIAGRLMADGSFGIGDFSLFIAHLGTLADCVSRVVELVYEARKAEVSYERLVDLLDEEAHEALSSEAGLSLRRPLPAQEQAYPRARLASFAVDSLSFAYADEEGFSDVSFSVAPGEMVAIAGGMASGKSTLLGVLMGLMRAKAGAMRWNGEAMPLAQEAQTPARVAGAPQQGGFFAASIAENLRLGQAIPAADIDAALAVASLQETVAAMPKGMETNIGGRGDRLSGGQRQRLALARVLARGATVSIIDDCVSALDAETRRTVIERLKAYLRQTGHAAIIATNEPALLRAADRIVLMEKGRVQAVGTYPALAEALSAFAGVSL